ncbi:BGTF surface domain-containing protein [Halobacterium wangiae]|uniref:DUF7827 domain-containing protein n=1 Tax=Halobacterium wangiae TaxID=2902623 RepID=UPI001E56E7EC|nr:BGTF surface domain-containing protein [Halobacterium wangiae]
MTVTDGDDGTTFNDGGIVFQGQSAAYDAFDADGNYADNYTLYERIDGSTGSPVRELDAEGGWVNASTSGLDTGTTYFISNDGQNPTNADATFTIRQQDFSTSFATSSVANNAEVDLTIESTNRQNNAYDVYVTSSGLDDSELVDVFANFGSTNVDVNGDDDVDGDGIQITVDAGGDVTEGADFTGIDAGEYSFDFDVTDTTASDSGSVNVTDAAEANSQFESITQTARGDIATVNVSLTSATQATVKLGSESSGYLANVTVTDSNEDGYATFNINTYTMGNNTAANASEPGVAFYTGAEGDTVDSVDIGTEDLENPIADGNYRATVRTGADSTATANDVSRLSIVPADGVTGQTVWTAPGGSVDDIADVLSDAPLSEDDSIAEGDYVIHEVTANGVFGVLQNASTVNDTEALLNASANGELSLSVEQTEASTRQNRNAKTLNYTEALDNGNAVAVTDSANSTVYIVADLASVNTESATGIQWDQDVYNASVTLNAASNLVSANSTAAAEFSADSLETSLSMNEYEVESASNQTITAETTAADGTAFNVLIESIETPGDGFIKPDNGATAENGEINAQVDFSDVEVDSTFSIDLEDADGSPVDDATGTVVESTGGTTTTTADDTTTTTTADDTTTTTTEEPDDTTTTTAGTGGDTGGDDGGDDGGSDGGIPGFGMGIALVAILGAALLALRE